MRLSSPLIFKRKTKCSYEGFLHVDLVHSHATRPLGTTVVDLDLHVLAVAVSMHTNKY